MAETATIDVEILGQVFTVRSDEGEEHVRQVAREVDARMRDLISGGRISSTYAAAVLTALNMASECQKLRAEQVRIAETVARLTARLAEVEGPGGATERGEHEVGDEPGSAEAPEGA